MYFVYHELRWNLKKVDMKKKKKVCKLGFYWSGNKENTIA